MKYLCLAYGDEKDWNVLTKKEQGEMLAQDEVLRERGVLVAAVQTTVTTVRAWDGKPTTTDGAFADSKASLAGFSIIDELPNIDGWLKGAKLRAAEVGCATTATNCQVAVGCASVLWSLVDRSHLCFGIP
jgi:hypothetical protein